MYTQKGEKATYIEFYALIINTNVTDTRISAPVISNAVRVTNSEAVVKFDPQDEENADQFLIDYYVASNLNTANKVLASYIHYMLVIKKKKKQQPLS